MGRSATRESVPFRRKRGSGAGRTGTDDSRRLTVRWAWCRSTVVRITAAPVPADVQRRSVSAAAALHCGSAAANEGTAGDACPWMRRRGQRIRWCRSSASIAEGAIVRRVGAGAAHGPAPPRARRHGHQRAASAIGTLARRVPQAASGGEADHDVGVRSPDPGGRLPRSGDRRPHPSPLSSLPRRACSRFRLTTSSPRSCAGFAIGSTCSPLAVWRRRVRCSTSLRGTVNAGRQGS